ncbi:MAG: dTDP-4-dehydrorhamnose 3,5-epimerase [Planctomycetaceae bacterium]|jgi:dTDP-4-dehydrorhamnose 3,5-epimerase|nr:dTDP-4-dehydrorhamnose 3,5-epimerase [Planctomycetaceae bacterium]
MKFIPLQLNGSYRIDLESRGDERGCFTRLFCASELKEIGHAKPIVNINHSYTKQKGTVRGLHFQYPPDCEIKIVKCIRGAVWDCIVDIRKGSPTFLRWDAVELTAENNRMIYVPEGFAHGFQTLTDDVEIMYFVTAFYAPNNEDGLRFNDPKLNIDWQAKVTAVSDKDHKHQLINDRQNWKGVVLT